jgi:hypothetical protein
LELTPGELNLKAEAWNDARRDEARRDYRLITYHAIAWHQPEKLPPFERFYPEVDESGKQKVDRKVERAMETARALGHI